MANKETSKNEKNGNQEFWELCLYVEKEIFGYESNQKLQKKAALRLRGLAKGQNIANNSFEQYGEYPYNVILLTFKANKNQIINAIRGKKFESEERKVAYVSAIVRDKLNDMYTRYLNAKKSDEKVVTINTDIMEYQGAEYKQTNEISEIDDKFEELW